MSSLLKRFRQEQQSPITPTPEPGRIHQCVLRLPLSALLDVLSGKLQIHNIPPGAKLISTWPDSIYDGVTEIEKLICVRIEHESLPTFVDGGRIPHVAALLRKPMGRER